jgi:hypothetical protein
MATAYPSIVHHRTYRVDPSTALSLLQDYLTESSTSPHLHPDAILTERGPQLSGSSEEGGLTLHHLRRVEAGLRGERLGDIEFEGIGAVAVDDQADLQSPTGTQSEAVVVQANRVDLEWQDMESYKREQEVEAGELGDRGTGSVVDGAEVPTVRSTGGATISKEERKEAKKQRHKEEQRQKEEARKREREMEMDVDG